MPSKRRERVENTINAFAKWSMKVVVVAHRKMKVVSILAVWKVSQRYFPIFFCFRIFVTAINNVNDKMTTEVFLIVCSLNIIIVGTKVPTIMISIAITNTNNTCDVSGQYIISFDITCMTAVAYSFILLTSLCRLPFARYEIIFIVFSFFLFKFH